MVEIKNNGKQQLLILFEGSNCKKCPACENGKCSDGRLGDGKCKCKILWGGKLLHLFNYFNY